MVGMVEDVAPADVWRILTERADAQLVDVRTDAEWAYVGVPDLSPLGRRVHLVQWQSFPTGAPNGAFLEQLQESGVTPEQPVFFICRSGARSLYAAERAQQNGYGSVFNVADGFEGPPDSYGHRGPVSYTHLTLPTKA